MPKKREELPQQEKTTLVINRDDANNKLTERIKKGAEFFNANVSNEDDYKYLTADLKNWNEYNIDLLKSIFNNTSISDEYSRIHSVTFIGNVYNPTPLSTLVARLLDTLRNRINKLASIQERLELFEDPKQAVDTIAMTKENDKIFIVHGRDNGMKETVARLVENLGLKAIILHEQANAGQTIIDKFETNAEVGFAIVLMTPDDLGGLNQIGAEQKPRARQNVIFELGYFIGRLGREKVCALYKGDVELPSDFTGVAYVPIDNTIGWKVELAKELKTAGYNIDMNKLF